MHVQFRLCTGIYLSQYLESVRPLLDDKDYQEMEALVKDFKVTRSHGMKKLVCRT